jgi:hypothetical protein
LRRGFETHTSSVNAIVSVNEYFLIIKTLSITGSKYCYKYIATCWNIYDETYEKLTKARRNWRTGILESGKRRRDPWDLTLFDN